MPTESLTSYMYVVRNFKSARSSIKGRHAYTIDLRESTRGTSVACGDGSAIASSTETGSHRSSHPPSSTETGSHRSSRPPSSTETGSHRSSRPARACSGRQLCTAEATGVPSETRLYDDIPSVLSATDVGYFFNCKSFFLW